MVIDIILGIIILGLTLKGLIKGLVYMVFEISKLFIAILLTPHLVDYLYVFIEDYKFGIDAKILAYIITFIIIVVIVSIIQKIVDKFLETIGMGSLNKLSGAILGMLGGLLISIVIMIFMLFIKDFNNSINEQLNTSKVLHYISIYTYPVNSLFPEDIKNKLDDFYYKNKKIEITNNVFESIKGE